MFPWANQEVFEIIYLFWTKCVWNYPLISLDTIWLSILILALIKATASLIDKESMIIELKQYYWAFHIAETLFLPNSELYTLGFGLPISGAYLLVFSVIIIDFKYTFERSAEIILRFTTNIFL